MCHLKCQQALCRVGQAICMNLLSSQSVFLSFATLLGNSAEPPNFWEQSGCCVKCYKNLDGCRDLFCANFGSCLGPWTACRQAWCPECYRYESTIEYRIIQPQDIDGEVWHVKESDADRFLHARRGDNFSVPFQCDTCVFRILTGREGPEPGSARDERVCAGIRRIILDSFWAREEGTTTALSNGIIRGIKMCKAGGIKPESAFPRLGPFPYADKFGYAVALMMVWESQGKGKHCDDYKQFDTIRKVKTFCSNLWDVSVEGVGQGLALGFGSEDKKNMAYLSNGPTSSKWMQRFTKGVRKRMGQDVRSDLPISIEVMLKLMEYLENAIALASDKDERDLLIGVSAYAVLSYCVSLRGNEGFMLDLASLIYFRSTGEKDEKQPFILAPLLGRFKTEEGERCHLLAMVSETASGLKPRMALERLVEMNQRKGRTSGPAFAGRDGRVARSSDYEAKIFEGLIFIQENCYGLIDANIKVTEAYGVFRSFRRGATTRATILRVCPITVEIINRWRKLEGSKGCKPSMLMREHYAAIATHIPSMLRFSAAM
jgi:hypothetical protein